MEDDLKKNEMEDDLNFFVKNWNDDLNKNGRRPQKNKNGRRPKKNKNNRIRPNFF